MLPALLMAAASGSFSFFAAEFEPLDRALPAAEAFVREQLPDGLPVAEVRTRLRAAALRCPRAAPGTAFVCSVSMLVHIGGGLIGEDVWSVRVEPDGEGRLRSAALDHRVIGTGPPAPD